MDNKVIGKAGEQAAADYLRSKGCEILARNYRVALGEIDLIAREGQTLVFVEVKTRRSVRCGRPAAAVNYYKQQKISRVAAVFLRQRHLWGCPCRFDVVEVYCVGEQLEVRQIKGAFEAAL